MKTQLERGFMKNKLLIIPVILLSILVSGCDWFKQKEADPIYIQSWLNCLTDPKNDPNAPTFAVKKEDGSLAYFDDYELVVGKALKSVISDEKGDKRKATDDKSKDQNKYLTYQIRHSLGRFTACNIKVFLDGSITTDAYGSGWGAPKSQHFLYTISTSDATKVIDTAYARYAEIYEDNKNQRENAFNEGKIENFIKAIEESKEIPVIDYRETRGEDYIDESRKEFTVHDDNRVVFANLKQIEFEVLETYDVSILPIVKYYIDPDWVFELYYDGWSSAPRYNVAAIRYRYKGQYKTYYPSYYLFYYALQANEGEAIADKVRELGNYQ